MDSIVFHIGDTARQLGCTPEHLRTLEREGRIPPAHRDFNGRIYTEFDIALLRAMGVGSRPARLRSVEEVVGDRP
jgi:DNA-binding transcriptional MerR regulator